MRIDTAKIRKRITRRDDRVFGIINYDLDNAYPQRVQDIVNGSGMAKSCIDIFFKFINGKGFLDPQFGKRICDGDKLTNDNLLRKNAKDYANCNGFAIHFNYNVLGQRTTYSYVPFAHCRLGYNIVRKEVVSIAVYDDWARERDKKINKEDIDFVNLYNPDPIRVRMEIEQAGGIENYKGQIYYHGFDGGLVYPLAYYDSELEDIETDSQIKLFKYKNISSSFMAANMIVKYGQSEGGQGGGVGQEPNLKNLNGVTKDDQDEAFVEGIKEFQGAENFGKSLVAFIDTPDQKPEIIAFPQNNNDKLFEYHEKSTQDNIRKVFAIPTIFLEAISGSLGLSKQLEDAVTFYNKMTQDERAVLEEAYSMLFSGMFPSQSFKIKELSMFDVAEVDGNIEAQNKIADAQAQLRWSVGGVTSLIALTQSVAAGTTSVEGGVAIIKAIYGYDDATARAMLQGVEQGSVPSSIPASKSIFG